jgi:hypothetical protein
LATKKISTLSTGTTANASDKIPIERSGANFYITPAMIATYAALLVEEVDGSPAGAATKIKFPNGTLAIVGGVATYTPAAGGGYTQGARVFNNSTQSLTAGVTLYSDYDTEEYDTDTIHDAVTNTKRLTCKTAGKYLIGGSGRIGSATAGTALNIRIRLNGANLIAISQVPAIGTNDYLNISTVFDLIVNDYVELGFTAAAGAAMIVDTQAYYTPEFWIQRIG